MYLNKSLYFIAELGQNHQGQLSIAKEMVDSLVGSGVHAIKTAKRDIDVCLTDKQKQMPYLNKRSFGVTYYEHRKALELKQSEFIELNQYANKKGFDFLSSFTDIPSLNFLTNECSLKFLKIASQRLTDIKLLKEAAKSSLGIIISTGMSTMAEVEEAVKIFKNNEKYLLQCTSSYPCHESNLNLNIINTYKEKFSSLVNGFGFSGHHMSIIPDIAAFSLGANIIERHYTLDRNMKGTDHPCSLELNEIKELIKNINLVEQSMGHTSKTLLTCEIGAHNKLRGDLVQ